MVVNMFKYDVSNQIESIYKEADEARKAGDYKTFYEYSKKGLELVNEWIDRQRPRINLKELNQHLFAV